MPQAKLIFLETVESTNYYAANILQTESPAEGTVIVAHEQLAGRGNGNNQWESEAGKNLTFTQILYPHFLDPARQFSLTQIVSLGLRDALSKYTNPTKLKIKWPNDLYYDNQKLAGILIQNTLSGNHIEHTLIGIGININQTLFRSKAPNPISLRLLSGKNHSLEEVLETILEHILLRYKQLAEQDSIGLEKDYLAHLYRLGSVNQFEYQGKVIKATILGVSEYGQLLLKSTTGESLCCMMKEIRFIL